MKQTYLFLTTLFIVLFGCSQKTTIPEVQVETPVELAVQSPVIPTDESVKTGVLPNGLTYYIKQNAKPEDKVSLRLVVNAGSILEDEKQLGLAHFMEHMNFNGTKNFQKNELVDYLQTVGVKFGAHLNAYTSFDETVYMLPIPSDDEEILEKGLLILEDWAHGALLTDEEIEKERGVVLEEYRIGLGADKRMLDKYIGKMMHGSRYAERLPIGTKEVLENFEPEDLRRYYKDWYRPDLMAVVAVGDIDVDDMEQRIINHFGGIVPASADAPTRKEFDVPDHEETFIAIESDKEAAFSQVQVMFKDPNPVERMKTVEDYENSLKRSLFSQMLNNRLNELVNGEDPPFIFGSSGYGGTFSRNKNAFQSFAFTAETDQLKALSALLTESERVSQFGFQQGELERAKKDILAFTERGYKERDKQESDRMVGTYVSNFLRGGALPSDEWSYEKTNELLPAIGLEDVNTLIDNYIQDENRVVVFTGPKKEGVDKVTVAEVENVLQITETAELTPYEDEDLGNEMMETPTEMGDVVSTSQNEKLGLTTIELSNGVTVSMKQTDFKNDEILMRAYRYGGTSLLDDDTYLKTDLAMGGLQEAGLNGFSINDMDKINTGKIARANAFIGGISEGLNGSSTPKDLETLFQMVNLNFSSLNKDEKAYGSFIQKQSGLFANILSNPNSYFNNEFGKFLNQDNPRYSGFPTAEDWKKSDYNAAYEIFTDRFSNADNFHFFFVGNFEEDELIDLSRKYLATLPSSEIESEFKDDGYRPISGNHQKTIYRGAEDKSSVSIRYYGETEYDILESYYLRSLGEILTIKLVEQLREEEGGVYGASARGGLSHLPYGSYTFSISFPCGPENADRLIESALAEVQKIAENGPTEKDLNKIKETQLLENKERLEQNRYWLNYLYSTEFNNFDPERVFGIEDRINDLTAKDIQKVAQKYLTGDKIIGKLMPASYDPEKEN